MKKNLGKMRENYAKSTLHKADVDLDPIQQFDKWFKEAAEDNKYEANTMHLSTVDSHGQPQGRIVLLKHYDQDGFVFFTRYISSKGQAISGNNKVALTFHWPAQERQVRIEGLAEKVSAEVSDDYFYSRPLGSQIGAAASMQSQEIEDYTVLENAAEQISAQSELKRPEDWGGYNVVPTMLEFWQGRPNRLHDRIQYKPSESGWIIKRLAP